MVIIKIELLFFQVVIKVKKKLIIIIRQENFIVHHKKVYDMKPKVIHNIGHVVLKEAIILVRNLMKFLKSFFELITIIYLHLNYPTLNLILFLLLHWANFQQYL